MATVGPFSLNMKKTIIFKSKHSKTPKDSKSKKLNFPSNYPFINNGLRRNTVRQQRLNIKKRPSKTFQNARNTLNQKLCSRQTHGIRLQRQSSSGLSFSFSLPLFLTLDRTEKDTPVFHIVVLEDTICHSVPDRCHF